jgi:hypothetical protein
LSIDASQPRVAPPPDGTPGSASRVGAARLAANRLAGYPAGAALLVLLGFLLRLRQWWWGRSMWFDEIELAVNLRDRGFVGLLHQLAQGQAAPFGWLWSERLAVDVAGVGDHTLRLPPLVFGVGVLVVLAWAARQLLATPAALVVLAFAALHPSLIYYSVEVKQYSAETFWVTLLVALALAALRRPPSWRRTAVFWVLAVVGATMSMMALPVGGAVGAVLTVHAWRARARPVPRRDAMVTVLGPAVWCAAAAGIYLATLRRLQGSDFLQGYWARVYRKEPVTHLPATLRWAADTGRALLTDPFTIRYGWVFALLVLVGLVRCWRRHGLGTVAVLVAPAAIGLVAIAASVYPYSGRLAVYSVPAILLLAGCAFDRLGFPRLAALRSPAGLARLAAVVVAAGLALAVAVPWLVTAVDQVRRPVAIVEYRQAVQYVADSYRPGDVVLGSSLADRPLLWYGRDRLGLRHVPLLVPGSTRSGCRPDELAGVLRGHTRVWLWEVTGWGERIHPMLHAHLQQYGRQVDVREFQGARVLLYDLTAPPGGPVDEQRYLAPFGYDCVHIRPA